MDNEESINLIKETRNLVWMCIIFVFLLMMLLLMALSGNYRTEKSSSLIVDRVSNVQTDLSSVTKSLDKFAGLQKALAKDIKNEVKKMNRVVQNTGKSIDKIDQSVGKVITIQSSIISKMSSNGKAVSKSISTALSNQQKIIKDINNLHNTERMVLLRKFIENQTAMLNELSSAMEEKPAKQ